MRRTDPDRQVYLAVDRETAASVFAQEFGRRVADDVQISLIVVDVAAERIMEWKQFPSTVR
jgi:hypothetical protein